MHSSSLRSSPCSPAAAPLRRPRPSAAVTAPCSKDSRRSSTRASCGSARRTPASRGSRCSKSCAITPSSDCRPRAARPRFAAGTSSTSSPLRRRLNRSWPTATRSLGLLASRTSTTTFAPLSPSRSTPLTPRRRCGSSSGCAFFGLAAAIWPKAVRLWSPRSRPRGTCRRSSARTRSTWPGSWPESRESSTRPALASKPLSKTPTRLARRARDRARRANRVGVFESGFEANAGRVELSLLSGQDPGHVERVRAELRRHVPRGRDRGLQSLTAFGQIAAAKPKNAHPDDEPQRRRGVSGVEREGESGAKVVVLVLEASKPSDLVAVGQLRFSLLRKGDEVLEVPAANLGLVDRGRQSLEGVH